MKNLLIGLVASALLFAGVSAQAWSMNVSNDSSSDVSVNYGSSKTPLAPGDKTTLQLKQDNTGFSFIFKTEANKGKDWGFATGTLTTDPANQKGFMVTPGMTTTAGSNTACLQVEGKQASKSLKVCKNQQPNLSVNAGDLKSGDVVVNVVLTDK